MSSDSLEPIDQPADTSADGATDGAGALSKALDVLELVMSSVYPPSAAAITDALNLPRPTTNRIIGNLVRLDFLKRDARQRQLIEGDRLLKLALDVVARATQRGPRHDILRELSDRTGETCNVGVITGGRVRYVDRVEARWPLSLRLEPGSEIPLHCTAIGKLLLAYLPHVHREKYLMTIDLARHTEHTVTDVDTLRAALDQIVEEGVSLDDEEYLPGVVGMAVPIPNGDNPPIMGLAIAAPSARVSIAELRERLPLLREFAQRMTLCY